MSEGEDSANVAFPSLEMNLFFPETIVVANIFMMITMLKIGCHQKLFTVSVFPRISFWRSWTKIPMIYSPAVSCLKVHLVEDRV